MLPPKTAVELLYTETDRELMDEAGACPQSTNLMLCGASFV